MSNAILYLAQLHAHVCGDGHIYTEKGEYGRGYIIEYTNKDKLLINDFINNLYKLLGKHPTIIYRWNKKVFIVRAKSKSLYKRLVSLGAGKSKEWKIPSDFINNHEIFIEWLSAYIDDKAYIDDNKYRIILNSVNIDGLKQICNALEKLEKYGYMCTIYNYDKYNFSRLIISKRRNMCELAYKLKLRSDSKRLKVMKACTDIWRRGRKTAPF